MIKNKWTAAPYLVWMAIFVIVPLLMVIYYALTNDAGQFTLENIFMIGRYSSVYGRSLLLAAEATIICLIVAFPVGYFLSRLDGNKQHIMLMLLMLPICLDDPSGKQRPDQPPFGCVWHRAFSHDQYQRRRGAGHGV